MTENTPCVDATVDHVSTCQIKEILLYNYIYSCLVTEYKEVSSYFKWCRLIMQAIMEYC